MFWFVSKTNSFFTVESVLYSVFFLGFCLKLKQTKFADPLIFVVSRVFLLYFRPSSQLKPGLQITTACILDLPPV